MLAGLRIARRVSVIGGVVVTEARLLSPWSREPSECSYVSCSPDDWQADGVIRVRWTSSPRNGPYRLADAGVVIHYRCGSVSPQAGRLPCYPGTSLLLHFLTDGIYTIAVRNDLGWRLVVA